MLLLDGDRDGMSGLWRWGVSGLRLSVLWVMRREVDGYGYKEIRLGEFPGLGPNCFRGIFMFI